MNRQLKLRALLINAPRDHEDWRAAFCEASGIELVNVRSVEQLNAELQSAPAFALIGDGGQDIDALSALCAVANNVRRCPIILLGEGDYRRLQGLQLCAQEVGVPISAALRGCIDGVRLARTLSRVDEGTLSPTVEELRQALMDQSLSLYFQPKFDCRDRGRRIVSLEALVRWEHPELGLLLPGQFLPLARDNNLLLELTDFTLTESIHQIALWRERKLDVTVAVNLATELLHDAYFGERLLSYLRQFDVAPERLVLEVQEAPWMSDRRTYLDILTTLQVEGVGLALDDFGTGYSSLTELYRSPFQEVKLDASLVADAARSPRARNVVRSIITLAHDLSMTVCAEAVESRAVLDFLVGAGCDFAQGNFLCEPRTLFELEPLLTAQGRMDGDTTQAPVRPRSDGYLALVN
jgi:EAL domain-containing protein (putative c-di-GMP-specific phosphodiesterase class I)